MIAETLSTIASLAQRALPRAATLENPSMSLSDPDTWNGILSGTDTEAGIKVTHRGALKVGAVWQSVSIISGDIACMTLNVYKRLDGDDREIDRKHPAQFLISEIANDETPACEFWQRLMIHALLWGNGYAFIRRNRPGGRPVELLNLLPDRTAPKRLDDGGLVYVTEVDGHIITVNKEDMLHIKGLSLDNGLGADLVEKMRNAVALALAAEGFNSKFFANGAQAGGILELSGVSTPASKTNTEEGFKSKYTGKGNWFKTMILHDGAKFHATTIDAEKSQMHELRDDQVRDVARFFNLPPSKLGLSDAVSYNSLEQSQLAYLTGTLNHWRTAIVGEVKLKLLAPVELRQRTHYVEHNTSKLIEIDSETMTSILSQQITSTIINPNEARRKLNLNRREGGDEYGNPNTSSPGGPPPDSDGDDDDNPDSIDPDMENRLAVLREAINRMASRVASQARGLVPGTFIQWVEAGHSEHALAFDKIVLPALRLVVPDANAAMGKVAMTFFATLCDALRPFGEPGHSGNDLKKNIDAACVEFEATIADTIINNLSGDSDETQSPTD